MDKIGIFQAGTEDFNSIKNLMLEALQTDPTAFSADFDDYANNSNDWWRSYLFGYIHKHHAFMLLAKDKNETIGMLGVLFDPKNRHKHVASIVWFYVKNNYRNTGIGKKIFERLINQIKENKEIKKITLLVNHPQEHALAIYKKFGFEVAGILKNELIIEGSPVNEYILEYFI